MIAFSIRRVMSLAALLMGIAGIANAQQPSSAQINAVKQNCRSDYQSLCSAVPPGGQASLNCLSQHAAQLSPACGQAVAAVSGGGGGGAPAATQAAVPVPPHGALSPPPQMSPREEMMIMRQACGNDYRRLCAGVPLGGGNALRCLANHSMSLSHRCEQALMMMHAAR